MQVDLFFYREPEEAKEQEGDEAIAAPEYGIPDYSASALGPLPGDQWGAQISDAQWAPEMVQAPPIVDVPGSDWSTAPAPAPASGICYVVATVVQNSDAFSGYCFGFHPLHCLGTNTIFLSNPQMKKLEYYAFKK